MCHSEKYPEEEFVIMAHGSTVVNFSCKACMKCFQKDMSIFESADEYCPHCGNQTVIPAELPDGDSEDDESDLEKM